MRIAEQEAAAAGGRRAAIRLAGRGGREPPDVSGGKFNKLVFGLGALEDATASGPIPTLFVCPKCSHIDSKCSHFGVGRIVRINQDVASDLICCANDGCGLPSFDFVDDIANFRFFGRDAVELLSRRRCICGL